LLPGFSAQETGSPFPLLNLSTFALCIPVFVTATPALQSQRIPIALQYLAYPFHVLPSRRTIPPRLPLFPVLAPRIPGFRLQLLACISRFLAKRMRCLTCRRQCMIFRPPGLIRTLRSLSFWQTHIVNFAHLLIQAPFRSVF